MICIRCECNWDDWLIEDDFCPLCREELENKNEKFCKECLTDQWHEDVQDDKCWECREKEKK